MEVALISMKTHFNLIFFPNPTTGMVYLSQNMLTDAKVEIKTILGKVVLSQNMRDEIMPLTYLFLKMVFTLSVFTTKRIQKQNA